MPHEPSTMKQRIANSDKKERMETSQLIIIRKQHFFSYYINGNTTEFHSFCEQHSSWAHHISATLVCANFLDLIASEDIKKATFVNKAKTIPAMILNHNKTMKMTILLMKKTKPRKDYQNLICGTIFYSYLTIVFKTHSTRPVKLT